MKRAAAVLRLLHGAEIQGLQAMSVMMIFIILIISSNRGKTVGRGPQGKLGERPQGRCLSAKLENVGGRRERGEEEDEEEADGRRETERSTAIISIVIPLLLLLLTLLLALLLVSLVLIFLVYCYYHYYHYYHRYERDRRRETGDGEVNINGVINHVYSYIYIYSYICVIIYIHIYRERGQHQQRDQPAPAAHRGPQDRTGFILFTIILLSLLLSCYKYSKYSFFKDIGILHIS